MIDLDSFDLRTLQKEASRALLTMDGSSGGYCKVQQTSTS